MKRELRMLVVVALLGLAGPAAATNAVLEIQESHWLEAMRIGRVNSEILYAISLQESGTSFNGMRNYGPWPWTMNINNEPRYYSSRAAARHALASEVEAGNRSVAVGMWQIYLRYNDHYVDNPLDLIDPVTNLFVAAQVLRDCGNQYKTTRNVLSCYHSGDLDEAGLDYADRVLKLAHKWGNPYRLSETPPEVLFTHLQETPPSTAPDQRVISIDRIPETPDNGLSTADLVLASDRKAPSQDEFIDTLIATETAYVQRVIVVE